MPAATTPGTGGRLATRDAGSPRPVDALPPYQVRRSSRARRAHLVVTPEAGLVVVVPTRLALRHVPGIVASRAEWIARAMARCADERALYLARGREPLLPGEIDLRAVGHRLAVTYRSTGDRRVAVSEIDGRLVVAGDDDEEARRQALRRWLARTARLRLIPWLDGLALDRGLDVTRVTIRTQRSRWGSCSARGAISLNQNLLFLPERLVRLVLLHELCHRIELNHSPRFWRLLEAEEPELAVLAGELRGAARFVPRWAEPPPGPAATPMSG